MRDKHPVVICSKFITFAVTKTTHWPNNHVPLELWFAQNSLPLRWQRQRIETAVIGDWVVICSKFITFAVTKTTECDVSFTTARLWFAQNSLPLRWQRQRSIKWHFWSMVVICSKFITFAVTKTTLIWYLAENQRNVECIRNKKRCCLKRRTHG